MPITDYQTLIHELPTRQQAFTARRTTWENIADKVKGFYPYFNQLFPGKDDDIQISRQDIFDPTDTKIKILKTIIWGYPRGMRGNHFASIINHLSELSDLLRNFYGKNISKLDYEDEILPTFKATKGLGLSTYSKLLYFFEIEIDGRPCLILDERLLRIFREGQYAAFEELSNKPKSNPAKWYVDYLRVMNKQAQKLNTQAENLEQFLFLFGGYLKG